MRWRDGKTQLALERQERLRGIAIRTVDVVAAVFGLILVSPVALLIVVAIVLEDGGPILFAQNRLGQGAAPFLLYKFRKFGSDCGTGGTAVTLQGDPRMTRVGRIIERTKLDELPQLWNILRGDMSLVGPRPESLAFADCFRGEFQRLLEHRPGLFGPSQAQFRNECAMYPELCDPEAYYRAVLFPAKARIDLGYYPRRSMARDAQWVVRSLMATLRHVRLHMPVPGHAPKESATVATR